MTELIELLREALTAPVITITIHPPLDVADWRERKQDDIRIIEDKAGDYDLQTTRPV